MLYVHPNLLPGVRGLPAGLVLSRPALLPVPHKPASRSLEAAAASFVSVCAGLFIPQRQVAPILSNISPDRSFLFCRLLPRKATRCARPVLQAFQRPTISLLPFAHGLSTWPVPVRRCAGSLLCRVFQRPLTIVGCLCYLVLGELLRGGGLFALLSCHCRVLFCVAAVTYVLYRNSFLFFFALQSHDPIRDSKKAGALPLYSADLCDAGQGCFSSSAFSLSLGFHAFHPPCRQCPCSLPRRRIAAASCPVALAAANSNRRFKSGFILSRRNSALLSACPASTAQPCRSQQSEYLAKPFLSSFVSWQIRIRAASVRKQPQAVKKTFGRFGGP